MHETMVCVCVCAHACLIQQLLATHHTHCNKVTAIFQQLDQM